MAWSEFALIMLVVVLIIIYLIYLIEFSREKHPEKKKAVEDKSYL